MVAPGGARREVVRRIFVSTTTSIDRVVGATAVTVAAAVWKRPRGETRPAAREAVEQEADEHSLPQRPEAAATCHRMGHGRIMKEDRPEGEAILVGPGPMPAPEDEIPPGAIPEAPHLRDLPPPSHDSPGQAGVADDAAQAGVADDAGQAGVRVGKAGQRSPEKAGWSAHAPPPSGESRETPAAAVADAPAFSTFFFTTTFFMALAEITPPMISKTHWSVIEECWKGSRCPEPAVG